MYVFFARKLNKTPYNYRLESQTKFVSRLMVPFCSHPSVRWDGSDVNVDTTLSPGQDKEEVTGVAQSSPTLRFTDWASQRPLGTQILTLSRQRAGSAFCKQSPVTLGILLGMPSRPTFEQYEHLRLGGNLYWILNLTVITIKMWLSSVLCDSLFVQPV